MLDKCPYEFVDREIVNACQYADLYKRGLPPVAGGALDQAKWFVDVSSFLWAEEAAIKAELGLF